MLKRISNWLRAIANWLSPLPTSRYSLTATITDDNSVDYTFSKDMSPELFGKLVVRMAIMTDGAQFIKKLTENGYVDAFYRLQITSNQALASIFDTVTKPSEDKAEAPKEQTSPTDEAQKAEPVERPVIEALVG